MPSCFHLKLLVCVHNIYVFRFNYILFIKMMKVTEIHRVLVHGGSKFQLALCLDFVFVLQIHRPKLGRCVDTTVFLLQELFAGLAWARTRLFTRPTTKVWTKNKKKLYSRYMYHNMPSKLCFFVLTLYHINRET